jgi:hypothetical protein
MFDMRFKNPSSFILAGPTQCGKTTFVFNMLRYADLIFEDGRCKQNVVYYYNIWQNQFDEFSKENIVTEFVNKLPSVQDVIDKTQYFKEEGGSIIIIDDFGQRLNKDIAEIFSVLMHHTNSVVILLMQNIFSRNPVFRDISISTTYIIMFNNPRDSSQISHFAKQFYSQNPKFLVEAFHAATDEPYSYMLFDLAQKTPKKFKVRSRVLPHELPMIIWTPRHSV